MTDEFTSLTHSILTVHHHAHLQRHSTHSIIPYSPCITMLTCNDIPLIPSFHTHHASPCSPATTFHSFHHSILTVHHHAHLQQHSTHSILTMHHHAHLPQHSTHSIIPLIPSFHIHRASPCSPATTFHSFHHSILTTLTWNTVNSFHLYDKYKHVYHLLLLKHCSSILTHVFRDRISSTAVVSLHRMSYVPWITPDHCTCYQAVRRTDVTSY